MEFRLLGPLEIVDDGQTLPLPAGKALALLAALLLRRNKVVSTGRLIDDLWGLDPPDTAVNTLQVHVSQLRKALGRGDARSARGILVTRAPGYLLALEPEQVDVEQFERLLAEGRQALGDGEAERAAALLADALSLWRGPPLADLADEAFAQPEIARLDELRLSALEERFEAELGLGRHTALVAELEATVAEHPLRERLRRQLMLALYRSGRQADALGVYQQTRHDLVEELGIEPSPALQKLEKAILLQDPALQPAQSAAVDAAPEAPARSRPPDAPRREVRKTVSVLVAEVGHWRDADPEAQRRTLDTWFESAQEVLVRHGGRAERLLGDALLGVLGIPSLHEDDALRAVRAAVDLREVSVDLEIRIGVSTGEVLARESASPELEVGGAIVGDAARLAREVGAGGMALSESTRRLVAHAVRVEPLGGNDAGAGWRFVELQPGLPAVRRRLDTALVGREQELEWLRRGVETAVRERRTHLLTVLGPAGIGKSRLAQELTLDLRQEARVLVGRCLSYGRGSTFWPLAEILRQLGGDDPEGEVAQLLGGDEEAQLIASRLAAAVGLQAGTSSADEVSPSVRKLFEALARERPLLVVLDDVHWAEPTFLDLIEHVRDWTHDAPVCLLCLARPDLLEARPAWGSARSNASSFFLTRLSDGDADALIERIAGRELVPAQRSRIAEAAEGNPLFIEQMLAMVLGDEPSARAGAVPPTIQALLAARLDALEWQERTLLEIASVVGREFSVAVVADLAPDSLRADCTAHLQALLDKELIRAGGLDPTGEAMIFRHVLIRDVAYESIPKERRATLHEQVALWLEARLSGRTGEYEEILGYHFERACGYRGELGTAGRRERFLASKGARYLESGGRRAYALGDLPAARTLLARAAALLSVDDLARLALLPDLGDALRESGDFTQAEAVLAEAVERSHAAGARGPECHALAVRARMQLQVDTTVSTDEILVQLERAIDVFDDLGDDRGLARAWTVRAWVPWFRCQATAAEAALERAIAHAHRAGDERTEAQSLNLLVGAAVFGPLPVEAGIARCRQILERYIHRRRVVASAFRGLAGLTAMEGKFDEAREFLARDQEILRDLGLTVTLAVAGEAAAIVELLAGEPAAAEQELRRGYEALEELGEKSSFSTVAAVLAQAAYAQGKYDEALEWTELSERAAAPDDVSTQIQWRGPRAKILARRGRLQAAERIAREAVTLAAKTDFLNIHGDALADLAEVLRIGERALEARAAIEKAVGHYHAKGNVVSAARARVALRALGGVTQAADEVAKAG